MHVIKSIEEIKKTFNYSLAIRYSLCYICPIASTIIDYTPETKEFMQTEEYRLLKEQHDKRVEESMKKDGRYKIDLELDEYYSKLKSRQYPNPLYIPGKQTYSAFFTSRNLKEQWGDGWSKCPFEYNSDYPYETQTKQTQSGIETDIAKIIEVPFFKPDFLELPNEMTGSNSPFSVEMINSGAIAWLFDIKNNVSISAGTNILEFVDTIERIVETNGEIEEK